MTLPSIPSSFVVASVRRPGLCLWAAQAGAGVGAACTKLSSRSCWRRRRRLPSSGPSKLSLAGWTAAHTGRAERLVGFWRWHHLSLPL